MAKKKEPTKEELQLEKLAKSFRPGTGESDSEQQARLEDMERRYKHRVFDFKYGTFNPKLLVIRFVLFFVVLWIIGYISQERDRARAERELEERIARSKEYARKEAEAKAYRDAQESYRVVQEFYSNGLPDSKKRTGKIKMEGVKIRPVGHGKYDEYTIEAEDSRIEIGIAPEDILNQIDDEDILDYMDGNID